MGVKKSEWVLDRNKFLEKDQVRDLLEACKSFRDAFHFKTDDAFVKNDSFISDEFKGKRIDALPRSWFAVKLGLNTGLRVLEMAKLRCGDFNLNTESPSVFVREGKGRKQRRVRFSGNFKKDVLDYFEMKKRMGQSTQPLYKVFWTKQSGGISTRSLQKYFKMVAEMAGLNECYSIHCLRHTYASFLYNSSNHNLRLVQLQLGHSSIQVTQVYTHLIDSKAEESFDKLYDF